MSQLAQFPTGTFGAILADFPWRFATYDGASAVPTLAGDPYPTMSTAELMAMDVGRVARADCALFLWVVDAHLLEALAIAQAWGFTYKTCAFVWVKVLARHGVLRLVDAIRLALGMGYWTRKQAELCLLFTRGSPPRLSRSVRQVILAPRREHSRKPDETRDRIEALTAGPYLELFARQSSPGWATWGNDVARFDVARAA